MSPSGSTSDRRERAETPAPTIPETIVTETTLKEDLKIPAPDKYDGNPATLNQFLMKASMYMGFHSAKFKHETEMVLFVITRLVDRAYDWIEPHLEEFWNGTKSVNGRPTTAMSKTTQEYFMTMNGLKKGLTQAFGDIDLKKKAEMNLQRLRQTGSAARYNAEFQQHAARLGFNDSALKAQFYKGLKDHVKDELARSDAPDDLRELVEAAIKIDNRAYERRLEKKGSYSHHQRPSKNRYGDPMELDATSRRELAATFRPKPKLSKEKMNERREKGLCYECGLPGHQAASHRKGKQQGNHKPWKGKPRQLNGTTHGAVRQLAATRRVELTEADLEARGIHSQLGAIEAQRIQDESPPLYTTDDERSGDSQDEYPTGTPWRTRVTSEHRLLNPEDHSGPVESDLESEATSEVQPPTVLPEFDEYWYFFATTEAGNVWKNRGGQTFTAPHQTTGAKPSNTKEYVVSYVDLERVAFREVGTQKVTVEGICSSRELPHLADVLEPGEIWEIIRADDEMRVWKRVVFVQGQHSDYVQQQIQSPSTNTLKRNTPYRLKEWATHHRVWTNMIQGTEVVEVLRNARELYATVDSHATWGQISVDATLRGKKLRVMIDSGANSNYISPATIARLNIPIVGIPSYELQVIDGTQIDYNNGVVNQGTIPSKLVTKDGHTAEVQFDIAPIGEHDAILGMKWIREHNPEIDWANEELTFSRCHCVGSQ